MRSQEEVAARFMADNDPFGFAQEALAPYLPQAFVDERAKGAMEDTRLHTALPTRDAVVQQMREYMVFAWKKVKDHRGITAVRSVIKMREWLWLLEDNELVAFAEAGKNYNNYGAPVLRRICEVYCFTIPDDEGLRNMALGQLCNPSCDNGCGY